MKLEVSRVHSWVLLWLHVQFQCHITFSWLPEVTKEHCFYQLQAALFTEPVIVNLTVSSLTLTTRSRTPSLPPWPLIKV